MDRGNAIQLIRDIDLRLAFLGVDLEAAPAGITPDQTGERALPPNGSRRPRQRRRQLEPAPESSHVAPPAPAATDAHGKEPS
jgi:hypothetical protein